MLTQACLERTKTSFHFAFPIAKSAGFALFHILGRLYCLVHWSHPFLSVCIVLYPPPDVNDFSYNFYKIFWCTTPKWGPAGGFTPGFPGSVPPPAPPGMPAGAAASVSPEGEFLSAPPERNQRAGIPPPAGGGTRRWGDFSHARKVTKSAPKGERPLGYPPAQLGCVRLFPAS